MEEIVNTRFTIKLWGGFSGDYIDQIFMFEHIIHDEVHRRNC